MKQRMTINLSKVMLLFFGSLFIGFSIQHIVLEDFIHGLSLPFILSNLLEYAAILIISLPLVSITAIRYIRNKNHYDRQVFDQLEQFRVILEDSQLGAFIYGKSGFIYVGKVFLDVLGHNHETFIGKAFDEVPMFDRNTGKIVMENARKRLNGEEVPTLYTVPAVKKDGTKIIIEVRASVSHLKGQPVIIGSVNDITSRMKLESQLIKSEQNLREAQRIANIGSCDFNILTGELYKTDEIYRIFGLEAGSKFTKYTFLSAIHPEDRKKVPRILKRSFLKGELEAIVRIVRLDGEVRTIHCFGSVVYNDQKQPEKLVGTIQDITENMYMSKRLAEGEEKYRSLFENNMDSAFILDLSGKFVEVNKTGLLTSGFTKEEMIGEHFIPFIHPRDKKKILQHFEVLIGGNSTRFECQVRHKSGDYLLFSINAVPIIVDKKVSGIFYLGKDITQQKKQEEHIQYLAYHDTLTGLANRQHFADELERLITINKAEASPFALLYMDLDRLKVINDHLGHEAGDQLLRKIGTRLKSQLSDKGTLFRIGGDEFSFLIPSFTTKKEVIKIAEEMLMICQQPYKIGRNTIHTHTSVGIALFPEHGVEAESLLKAADMAMYSAKQTGGNQYRIYDKDIISTNDYRFTLENDFQRALEEQEFFLVYQPKVDINTGDIKSAEALIRWNHPTKGLISPADFIPLAEETGFIVPLGEWVLKEACRQAKEWQENGLLSYRVAVNVSAIQFQRTNFDEFVREVLEETNLEPEWLEIEITEGTFMEEDTFTAQAVTKLKDMGIYISLDDFGTGYSSMMYLKEFRLHALKIDRGFIEDVHLREERASIVQAIIQLAHGLQMDVVAEGVETLEELTYIKMLGIDHVQGYYVSKPLIANQFENLIKVPK
ncbi:EAL domain-containing protein [Cytobacillus sp. FJAT-54145]|uniref:EAL domain-containing protein n=1 Tax=Cytobacillus spartinae TaxID=3299023 RepID=A0ABW6K5Y7_9BACI